MNKKNLPFALPDIGEEEIAEVTDCMCSGWVTTGPKTERFEKEFALATNTKHALAVNSATAGLHLALKAVGIAPGEYVITSPYTFTATAEVIRYFGAHPLFVDITSDTFNIDIEKIEYALQKAKKDGLQVKAIIPVHFAGQACNMDQIMNLAHQYHLKVVEDAAHAFPASYKGRPIGCIGDATVFSFYATKTICTGEGGMITTNDDHLATQIKIMRLHGISNDIWDRYSTEKPSWHYDVVAPGFKYNMTDVAAAMGIHQLKKAERFRLRREEISSRYTEAFKGLSLRPPLRSLPSSDIHSWHLYVIQLDTDYCKSRRDHFIKHLCDTGIGTSVHFIPLHLHTYWKKLYGFNPEDFPVATEVYNRAVSLPIYSRMTDDDIERVIDAVKKALSSESSL